MLDILMAIVDFIPVFMFLVAAIILQRSLYNKMSKGAFTLFASGTIFVFVAGFLKAIHKLLFYTGVCDFVPLREAFFPMQTIGFVLAATGLLAIFLYKQGEHKEYGILLPLLFVAPSEYKGTMIFVVLMVLGVLIMDGCLVRMSIHLKSKTATILLIVSFVFVLGMGYLSSKDDLSDWIKEIVNTIGQTTLLISVILMNKKGLANKDSLKGLIKQ